MSEILLPVRTHHCRTTHSACQCVLERLAKLEAENRQLIDERTKAEGEVLVERMKNVKLEAVAEAAVRVHEFSGDPDPDLEEALRAAGYLEGQDRGE